MTLPTLSRGLARRPPPPPPLEGIRFEEGDGPIKLATARGGKRVEWAEVDSDLTGVEVLK